MDPGTRTVHAYRGRDDVKLLAEGAELDARDVVPGWRVPVAELFA